MSSFSSIDRTLADSLLDGRQPPIELRCVTVSFPGSSTPVLQDVSLSLGRGRLMAVIGPSGAGKTVLLKTVCGLLPAESGEVRLAGSPLGMLSESELHSVRLHVGMLFQHGALFDTLSVLDNVAFPLLRRGMEDAVAAERALVELGNVGLARAAHVLPSELSGGMRKRVGIARALITSPPIALFDEPISGLDPVTGARILDLLRRARDERGVSGMVVGHEIDALVPLCDDVAFLVDGMLAYVGPSSGLDDVDHPAVRQLMDRSLEGPL